MGTRAALVGLTLGGLLLSGSAWAGVAAPTADGEPADAAALLKLFGAPDIKADYVIALDTSSSMSDIPPKPPAYKAAQAAVATFAEAVQQGDRVSLLTFSDTVEPSFIKQIKDPADRKELVATVNKLDFDGSATDIGAGLYASQSLMASPKAAEVQTLVMLSDGANNPPPGSYSKLPVGPQWRELGQRGRKLSATRVLAVTGIGLGTARGVQLLRRAFPTEDVRILNLPTDQLAGQFSEIVMGTQLNKIRANVLKDLKRGVSATVDVASLRDGAGELTVSNDRKKLAAAVKVNELAATTPDGKAMAVTLGAGAADTFVLGPGESTTIPVVVKPEGAVDTSLKWGSNGEWLTWNWVLDTKVTTPSSDVISRAYTLDTIDPKSYSHSAKTTGETDSKTRPGVPVWMIVLAVLLLAALAWLTIVLIRLWKIAPKLRGYLSSSDGELVIDLALLGTRATLPSTQYPLDGRGDSAIVLFTKPGPTNRRRVFVKPVKGMVRLKSGLDPTGRDIPAEGAELEIFTDIVIGDTELRYTLVAAHPAAAATA